MREVVFDTETTGLYWLNGDRLIEIGCVELLNHIPTGRTFHAYLNPRRRVHSEAALVHGLTDEFLRDKPAFEEILHEFDGFVGDSLLIAHNAEFDRSFINMELGLCGRPHLGGHRFVDTLLLARRRHPNGPNSLDALCSRYGIDNSARAKHGALLDAQILAGVYLELLGGRQASFALGAVAPVIAMVAEAQRIAVRPRVLPPRISAEEERAHRDFVATLGSAPVWTRYFAEPEARRAT
jgi:DNA polymerase III subunit epsilon